MSSTPSSAIRVLHVDDDSGVRNLLANALEHQRESFEVTSAANADEGLAVVDAEPVDCIVSDYQMPETDGLDFLAAVRDQYPDVPFVLYTAEGSEDLASDAISLGVTDYLQKETGMEHYALLANRIENVVEQYRAATRLEAHEDRLEALLADSYDIITVIDSHGEIQYTSPAVERILGHERDAVTGENILDYVHDQDRAAVEGLLPQDGQSESTAPARESYRMQAADGEWRWVESVCRDQRDAVDGYVLNTRDITERKTTQQRYRALVEQSTDAISIVDTEGRFQFMSPSIANVTDYRPRELEGESAFDYIHPDDVAEVEAALEQLLENPDASPVVEHRFAAKDGSWRWVETTGNNLLDNPSINGVVVNSRDITERKVRRRKIGRYETLLETLPVGVAALAPDATIEWVNEAFWTGLEKSEDEVVDEPFTDIIQEGLVDPEIADKYTDAVRTLLSSATETDRVSFDFEVDPPSAERSRKYEAYIGLQPLKSGEFNGTVNAFLDVTERKRRQRELEQYKAAMETVPDGVFMLDENGIMTRVNEAWATIVGYDPAELNGEPFTKLVEDGVVDASVIETYLDVLSELLSAESNTDHAKFNYRVTLPNSGQERTYEVHIGLLPYEDSFRGSAGVVRDVTERVHNKRQLERENERLEEFASVVSHDLRNPLNVVASSIELAEETGNLDHIDRVRRATERMEKLIDNLLTLARQGQHIESVDTVSLPQVVRNCWKTVETEESTFRIKSDVTIRADRERLKQLIENLLRNAVEHGGGDVTVTIGTLSDTKGFYIEDDGHGIPPAKKTEVFDSGYSTTADGTGFGLSIVNEIVEAHGWDIAVTEGAAGGARFEITDVAFEQISESS